MEHSFFDQSAVKQINEAFASGKMVTLALVRAETKPDIHTTLLLEVKDGEFCVIALDRTKDALAKEIKRDAEALCGIVSTEDYGYQNIGLMIQNAKKALDGAKDRENGIAYFNEM